jgi:ketosteroid isomerase-like protein
MTWLLTSQTILLGGHALLLTSEKDAKGDVLAQIHALQRIISIIGFGTAAIICLGVFAAIRAQGGFHMGIDALVLERHKAQFPQWGRRGVWPRYIGSGTALLMPFVFILVWGWWLWPSPPSPIHATVSVLAQCVTSLDRPGSKGLKGKEEKAIDAALDDWYDAAAKTDVERYLGHLADDSVFLGTDATERWDKTEFRAFVEPRFRKGKGWTYHAVRRLIVIEKEGGSARFEECLANEKYGAMRASGVLVEQADGWRIAQYHLALLIPNDVFVDVTNVIAASQAPPKPPP